jgi:hypothetical protein
LISQSRGLGDVYKRQSWSIPTGFRWRIGSSF